MFWRSVIPSALILMGGYAEPLAHAADLIVLKEHGSLSGKILADKPEYVVIDLGFTALTVPRSHISRVTTEKEAKSSSAASGSSSPVVEKSSQLYSVAKTPPPERSVRELAKTLGEAVVQVRTPGGLGSGFILNEEGFLITNFHVIEGETQISIEVYHQTDGGQLERKQYKRVRIVAMNKFQDLALLRIEDEGAPRFKRVLLGSSDLLGQGERVFAIGSPLGLERTVTEGILSTKSREVQGELYLQTTAQINPGNSGGPLFNMRGEVVGVTNMKVTFGEGIGFAIPVEAVRYFLEHRDAFAYDNDNPSNPYRYLPPPKLPEKNGVTSGAKKAKDA